MSGIDWSSSRQTNGGTRVKILEGPNFSGTENESDATWTVLIQEADFDNFLLELFPVPVTVLLLTANGLQTWSIKPPNMRLPGSATLYARSYTANGFEREIIDPFNADPLDPVNTYASVYKMEITFSTDAFGKKEGNETQDPQDKSTLFDDHTIDVTGQFLAVGDTDIKWKLANGNIENNDKLQVGAHKQIPIASHTLHRKRVLNPNWELIRENLGKINGSALTEANFGFPAATKTVMFLGVSGTRIGGRTGLSLWDMSYKLAHREFQDDDGTVVTWNHFLRPGKGWQELLRAADEKPIYESVDDLADIFRST